AQALSRAFRSAPNPARKIRRSDPNTAESVSRSIHSMPRNVIIALSAVLYVGLSVWLVGKQGQAYRESLRQDQGTLAKSGKPAPAQSKAPQAGTTVAGSDSRTANEPFKEPSIYVAEPKKPQSADHVSRPPHSKEKPKAKR